MAETALVSMAQQFTGLPMDSLIGAPLNAAANANAAMALTQTKFILDTGFGKTEKEPGDPSKGYIYDPVMIEMTMKRGVIQPQNPNDDGTIPPPVIEEVKTTFLLPLITVIPINSLGVDNVDVKFEMEVKSSYSEEQSEKTEKKIAAEASFEVKVGWGPVSATVKGSASYDQTDSSSRDTHYEKSNSAKYTVAVHAGQLPLPQGVNTIIQAYTNAIEPLVMPTGKDTE